MDATLPGDQALHLESAARGEWVANCEAAYPAVYRALIAIGASESDAADALQDAFEDALKQRGANRKGERLALRGGAAAVA